MRCSELLRASRWLLGVVGRLLRVFAHMSADPESPAFKAERGVAAIIALAPTVFTLLVLRKQLVDGFNALGGVLSSAAGVVALFLWSFAFCGDRAASRARMRFAGLGGLIVGAIGFAGGFFGPMIFTPKANQGPLLGIFFTGPLGFIAGAILGAIYGRFHVRGRDARSPDGKP